MDTIDVLRGWKTILAGRTPILSIEITKECPLACPGCYAFGDSHLGGATVLRDVGDFRGPELVERVMALVDDHRPLHVSIVGGEPLVRYKELNEILPRIAAKNIHTQVVTSAVRPIPAEWAKIKNLSISVSIDGLAPEHDVRRKPATYERILRNIEGHKIIVHCTITRQMTERASYLQDFVAFWNARNETRKIWMSLFTPQIGETSVEILPHETRLEVIRELLELRRIYPKLDMPKPLLRAYAQPPSDPEHCLFARTTTTVTANLNTRITPCQFGGTPDCSQCGCMASAGFEAIGRHKLPLGIPVSALYEVSLKVGSVMARMRRLRAA